MITVSASVAAMSLAPVATADSDSRERLVDLGDHFADETLYLNGTLFFWGYNGLWKSDGTLPGTVLVKKLPDRGGKYNNLSGLTPVAGKVFFTSGVKGEDVELWKSDGTTQGTVKITQIDAGRDFTGKISAPPLTVAGTTVYFRARSDSAGAELWKTDGTAKGTMMVKDINPGAAGSTPSAITAFGDSVLFTAEDSAGAVALWKSDGTDLGTVMVKAVEPESAGVTGELGAEVWFVVSGGSAFFSSSTGAEGIGLWKTDGTEAGTVLVKDITYGSHSAGIFELTGAEGSVFFAAGRADDAVGPDEKDLWYSDGTESGTVLVEDFKSGACCRDLTAVGESVVFTAKTRRHGEEFWMSDGTDDGTVLVKDIVPGSEGSSPGRYTLAGENIYFRASSGLQDEDFSELWQSDGTDDGTVMVPGVTAGEGIYDPHRLSPAVGSLFFMATPAITLDADGYLDTVKRFWRLAIPDAMTIVCTGVWSASC